MLIAEVDPYFDLDGIVLVEALIHKAYAVDVGRSRQQLSQKAEYERLVDGDGLYLVAGHEPPELAACLVGGVLPSRVDPLPEEADRLNLAEVLALLIGVLLEGASLRVWQEVLQVSQKRVLPDVGQLLHGFQAEHLFKVLVVVHFLVGSAVTLPLTPDPPFAPQALLNHYFNIHPRLPNTYTP
jgi:hypothetical protein